MKMSNVNIHLLKFNINIFDLRDIEIPENTYWIGIPGLKNNIVWMYKYQKLIQKKKKILKIFSFKLTL